MGGDEKMQRRGRMVIRKAGVLIVVAAALMGSLSANANNKSKTANSSKTGMPEAITSAARDRLWICRLFRSACQSLGLHLP
jgi:hypothetical protein